MKRLCLILGRICLSLIFVLSAISKLLSWNENIQYMASSIAKWMSGSPLPDLLNQGFSWMVSYSGALLVIATILEGVGGLCVLFGFKVRFGSLLLILFLIPVTFIMHPFWLEMGQEKIDRMTTFMKNLAILGGLLILAGKGNESEV